MIALDLEFRVYCDPCGRVVEIDMTKLPPEDNAIGVTLRCSECGRPGTSSISPRSVRDNVPRYGF